MNILISMEYLYDFRHFAPSMRELAYGCAWLRARDGCSWLSPGHPTPFTPLLWRVACVRSRKRSLVVARYFRLFPLDARVHALAEGGDEHVAVVALNFETLVCVDEQWYCRITLELLPREPFEEDARGQVDNLKTTEKSRSVMSHDS